MLAVGAIREALVICSRVRGLQTLAVNCVSDRDNHAERAAGVACR